MAFVPQRDAVVAGRYRLKKRIGEGGMGNVWEAIDQVLDCPIALKLVTEKDSDGDDNRVARFMREAKLSASVQHPSVVRVTDFGVHEDTPYIAMELLQGESLYERMHRLPLLEQDEAVQICVAILRGLGAAHDAGVVHRDIKPDNVLLVQDIEGVYPKLIDFGISLGVVRQERVSAVTTDGHVFGTPMYMSPEQARGLALDGRADLYSLGILLYEMLSRRTAFPDGSVVDLMAAIVRDVPTPPHKVRPSVNEALSAAVMRAVEKVPADRFGSAREMATALLAAAPGASAGVDTTGPIRLQRASSEIVSRFPAPSDDMDTQSGMSTASEVVPRPSHRRTYALLGLVLGLVLLGFLAWPAEEVADNPPDEIGSSSVERDPVEGAMANPNEVSPVRAEPPVSELPPDLPPTAPADPPLREPIEPSPEARGARSLAEMQAPRADDSTTDPAESMRSNEGSSGSDEGPNETSGETGAEAPSESPSDLPSEEQSAGSIEFRTLDY